jgi:hypothetical protein
MVVVSVIPPLPRGACGAKGPLAEAGGVTRRLKNTA